MSKDTEMTPMEKQAYEWALNQRHLSVAASYARVLAEYIRRALTETGIPVSKKGR